MSHSDLAIEQHETRQSLLAALAQRQWEKFKSQNDDFESTKKKALTLFQHYDTSPRNDCDDRLCLTIALLRGYAEVEGSGISCGDDLLIFLRDLVWDVKKFCDFAGLNFESILSEISNEENP
jgi:hypothetical protein